MRELAIYGFDRRMGSEADHVRWTDRNGKDHHCPLPTIMHYCEMGFHGLSKADKQSFEIAHHRYVVELERGSPLPFKGPIRHIGERVD